MVEGENVVFAEEGEDYLRGSVKVLLKSPKETFVAKHNEVEGLVLER